MSDEKPTNGPVVVSQTVLGDIQRTLGVIDGRTQEMSERIAVLPCHSHLEKLTELATKLEQVERVGEDRPGRSPSNLYEAVTGRIEKRGEEVTEKIRVVSEAAAREAVAKEVEERAAKETARLKQEREEAAALLKAENERELQRIDLQHKRAMNWLKVVAAALALLGGGTFATIRAMWSGTEAAQVETQKSLRRIEAKQAKPVAPRPPDAGVEP